LDGYVDHLEFRPSLALFRHFIEHVRDLTGIVYGRRMYEVMKARTFTFTAHKTMYGGKLITEGDTIFVFASENEVCAPVQGSPRLPDSTAHLSYGASHERRRKEFLQRVAGGGHPRTFPCAHER
jgi:hypothetical protein